MNIDNILGYQKIVFTYGMIKSKIYDNESSSFIELDSPIGLRNNEFLTYKNLNDIGDNEKYLYIINFFEVNFFFDNKDIGFKFIEERVLNDIKNNVAKLIIHCSTEGYSGLDYSHHKYDFETLQDWIDAANLPSKNVYYINGNLISKNIISDRIKFNTIGISVFEGWVGFENLNLLEFKPKNDNYLFLSLNRTPRHHRVYFLSYLNFKKLINLGKVSFNSEVYDLQIRHNGKFFEDCIYYTIDDYNVINRDDFINSAKELDKLRKRFIDTDTNILHQTLEISNRYMYEETFVSVITETLHFKDTLFITEKTWKTIAMGHPFMIIGPKCTLAELKSLGYKTFDKWFDESYDLLDDYRDRINIVVKNLEMLSHKTLDELKFMRIEMNDICKYNQDKFYENLKSRYFVDNTFIKNKPVLDLLYKIYTN